MGNIKFFLAAFLLLGATSAAADFELFEDYDLSEAVYTVDTIKVKPGATEKYLEGLKATWVASLEAQKKLGHVEDYSIYSSMTPQIGDFNLMLVTRYKNIAAMQPTKAKRNAFLKAMGREKIDASNKRALEEYPELREITGSYLVNEITMK